MNKKSAFASTVELVLITLLCTVVVGICLAIFTDNISGLFSSDRNYKKIFAEQKLD